MKSKKSKKILNNLPESGSLFLSLPVPHFVAHRGGSAAGKEKENTIAAFHSAANMGYVYLETDVILTKDGKILAYHGSRNRFLSWRTGLVLRRKLELMTYQEITKTISAGGEQLPLLDELCKTFPEALIKIDAKTDRVVEPLLAYLQEARARSRVCVATFNPVRMRRIKQSLAKSQITICLELLIAPTLMLVLCMPGLLKFYLQVVRTDIVGLPRKFISRSIIRLVHANNSLAYVWTVNSRQDIEKALHLGVDGIISDETGLLLQIGERSKLHN